jgi:CubicO group peptidase (beta-lactamase class C family)
LGPLVVLERVTQLFKTIWSMVVIITCVAVAGHGADQAEPPCNNVFSRTSGDPLSAESALAPVEDSVSSISIITEKPYTRRFLPLIQAIEQEMEDINIPGAAVAVIEAGETTFAAGLGSKHPHCDVPVEPSTLFRIGSVTKTLTAIGLLQLVDQRFVDLNAPVTEYLPDFSFSYDANWAPSITVRNLLTHTSAMADFFEIDTPGFKDDEALSRYFNGPYGVSPYAYLMAPAGRMFNYTNPGYMLAGLVTESVSGIYYRQHIQENVFAPLGMTRTFFLPEEVIADGDFAYGSTSHWETGEPFVVEPNSYDNGWGRPAGLAFSNVLDLAQIVKFLRAEQPDILTNQLRMAMQKPQVNMEMFLDLIHYGYGLIVEEAGFYHPTAPNFYRMRIAWHGGDVPGFSADLYYVPDLDFGFIALTNASYAHLDISFATALTTLRDMPAPTSIPDLSMTPADYDNYSGQYFDPYTVGDILVKVDNEQLTVEIPAFDDNGLVYDNTLLPNTPNNFILYLYGLPQFDVYPVPVTFIPDSDGTSEYFRTRSFVARYTAEIQIEPRRRRLFTSPRPTELLSVLDTNRHLPEPQLPFVRPPGQYPRSTTR